MKIWTTDGEAARLVCEELDLDPEVKFVKVRELPDGAICVSFTSGKPDEIDDLRSRVLGRGWRFGSTAQSARPLSESDAEEIWKRREYCCVMDALGREPTQAEWEDHIAERIGQWRSDLAASRKRREKVDDMIRTALRG
jgi:hypothetical protein